jgi:hypothetical protein
MQKPNFLATLPDHVRFDALRPNPAARADDPAARNDSPAAPSDDAPPEIAFTPVPRLRNRRDGWTPERQRAFISALAACGSVGAAAREAGVSRRGAYRLVEAPGGEDFARAWDDAVAIGHERTRCEALERALHGGWVPVYRKGKLVRVELRRSDRLAIALISGRGADAPNRWQRQDRAAHRADQREHAAAPPERKWEVLNEIRDRIDATWDAREAEYGDLSAFLGFAPPPPPRKCSPSG